MIFYTILSQYPDIDRANVVLTAMIIYIIIYIALPDKWNGLALGALASLDYIALKLPPFDTFHVYMLKLWRSLRLKKRFKRFIGGGPDDKDKKGKSKKDKKLKDNSKYKSKKDKSKDKKRKDKRVRFAKHNSYREFQSVESFKPQPPVQGGGQMNIPDWMLTPQQRIQRAQQNVLKQQQKALSTPGFMIDNRHLALSEDEDSSDESIASDESSELTNSEEGFDF
jgi:hypothetical protein